MPRSQAGGWRKGVVALLVGTLGSVACDGAPDDAVERGDRLYAAGQVDAAIAEYRLAVRQRGDEPELLLRLGDAYGSHVSLLSSGWAWDDIFNRKLHGLLYLASFQVSSIVMTGQGKVGAENGRPETTCYTHRAAGAAEISSQRRLLCDNAIFYGSGCLYLPVGC